jgi:amino acid transporter
MAQRIPRDESLSRVHGVGRCSPPHTATSGSSIYYALGVTAAFALGLTPIAFVISGLIFAATAATYAEATVMYPEAGGSSSFARHASPPTPAGRRSARRRFDRRLPRREWVTLYWVCAITLSAGAPINDARRTT